MNINSKILVRNNCLVCTSERTTEVEREIERQQLLEVERSKTRELRHNLEMEKEKQSQARSQH